MLSKAAIFALSALLILANGPASAQPGRGGPGGFDRGFGGVGSLLLSESVRGEISLQPEQLEELEAMRDEVRDMMRERMQGRFQGMRDMSPEERQEAMQDIRAEMEEIRADVEDRLSGVLTESQMTRLRQIELQQQMQRGGSRSLLRGPVADKLGLTEQQREQLRQKAEEEEAKLREQIQKLTQEARERVLTVLTASQRAQLDELMGERFDMPQQDFRGRGGRGGPGGQRSRRNARPELE